MYCYVDYEFYKNEYEGSIIPQNSFKALALKASAFLDYITFDRIHDLEEVEDNIRFATCSIMESMQKFNNDGGIKASESTGNYSVSYVVNNMPSSEGQIYYKEAEMYLGNTGLLYRGIR